MNNLPINLDIKIKEKEKSYPIIIDKEDISSIKTKILAHLDGPKFLVIISEKVNKLYGEKLGFSKEQIFVLKDGEKEKNLKNYQKITDYALKMQLSRKDTIVAIGGGVVGDLAGFVASTYMRGINFIQIPTTLLACVDSSVGGKTGINTKYGKNLIGAFYQPRAVLINTNFLTTLDEKQFKAGFGEVIKYALIEKSCKCNMGFDLTNFLAENIDKINSCNTKILAELISICVSMKASVVEKDEKEGNLRRILNFGHTYGHAIEKETAYKKFTHGESVVEGIKYAFNLAFKKGLIDKNYKHFADDLIKKFNFKEIPKFPLKNMIKHMQMDKKNTSEKLTFILPTDYSVVEPVEINPDELTE